MSSESDFRYIKDGSSDCGNKRGTGRGMRLRVEDDGDRGVPGYSFGPFHPERNIAKFSVSRRSNVPRVSSILITGQLESFPGPATPFHCKKPLEVDASTVVREASYKEKVYSSSTKRYIDLGGWTSEDSTDGHGGI